MRKSCDSQLTIILYEGFKATDVKLHIDKPDAINISGERITTENKRVHFSKAYNVPEDADMENITMKFQGNVLKVLVPRVPKEKEGEPAIKDEAPVSETAEEKQKPETPEEEITEEPKMPEEKEKNEEPAKPKEEEKEQLEMPKEERKKEEPEMPKDEEKKEEPEMPKDKENKEEPMMRKEEIMQKTSEDAKEDDSRLAQQEKNHDQREDTSPRSVIGKISEQKGILLASIISFTLGFLLSKRFQPPPPKN